MSEHVVRLADVRSARGMQVPDVDTIAPPPLVVDDVVVDYHPTRRTGTPRKVIPAVLRDWRTFTAAARWSTLHMAHNTAFHALRLPLYALKLLLLSPLGVWRLARIVTRWVVDLDGRNVRQTMSGVIGMNRSDAAVFLRLTQERRQTFRQRLLVVALATVALLLAGLYALNTMTRPTLILSAAGGVLVLGQDGASTRRMIDR